MFYNDQDDTEQQQLLGAGQQTPAYGAIQAQLDFEQSIVNRTFAAMQLPIDGDVINEDIIEAAPQNLARRFIHRMIECGIITQTEARRVSLPVLNSLARFLSHEVDLNAALRHFIFGTLIHLPRGFADDRYDHENTLEQIRNFLAREWHVISRQYPIIGNANSDSSLAYRIFLHTIKAVESGIAGFTFPIKTLWPLGFYSLLTYDIVNFILYPEARFGNTIFNILSGNAPNLTMTTQMGAEFPEPKFNYWFGISVFMAMPFAGAILNFIRSLIQSSILGLEVDISAFQENVSMYNSINRDVYFDPRINREPETNSKQIQRYFALHRALYQLHFSLLHNGRLSSYDRDQLLINLNTMLRSRSGLLRLHALSVAADIIYHHHAGYTRHWNIANEEALIANISKAIRNANLNDQGDWFPTKIFRSYLKWSLGENQSVKSQLVWLSHWLSKNALLGYAASMVLQIFVNKIIEAHEFYNSEDACKKNGMVWSKVKETGNFECSMCGDWENPHVYARDIYSAQSCVNALLQQPRTPKDIIDNVSDKIIHHPQSISKLPLAKQPWTSWSDEEFIATLNSMEPALATNPEILDFSLPANETQVPPTDIKIQAIANLIKAHVPKKFVSQNLPLTTEQVSMLSDGLTSQPNNVTVEVDFTSAKMGDAGAQVIATVMPKLPLLNKLGLGDNALHEEGITSICQSIASQNSTNIYLDISENTPGDDGLTSVANVASKLSGMDISRCEEISEDGLYAIAQAIPGSPIEKFYAEEIGMSDVAFRAISQTFQQSNLTDVNVADNDLTDLGIAYGFSQTQNSTVKSFNVARNILTDVGLQSMTQDLPNSSVEKIDVSESQFSSEGFSEFLNATTQSHVNSVIARDNQLTNQTTCDLAAILKDDNNPLQNIDISDNTIGGGVCDQVLAEVIPHAGVTSFSADRTGLSNEFTTTLLNDLSQTPQSTFQNVSLEGNGLNQTVAHILGVTISATSLVSVNMRNNSLGAGASDPLAKNMLQTPLTINDLQNPKLPPAAYRELSSSQPNTHVTNFYLDDNQLQNRDAIAICRAATQSKIAIQNVGLGENNIDPRVIDIHSCHVSAASTLQPFDWFGSFSEESVLPAENKLLTASRNETFSQQSFEARETSSNKSPTHLSDNILLMIGLGAATSGLPPLAQKVLTKFGVPQKVVNVTSKAIYFSWMIGTGTWMPTAAAIITEKICRDALGCTPENSSTAASAAAVMTQCATDFTPAGILTTGAGLFGSFAGRVFARGILEVISESPDNEKNRDINFRAT